MSAAKFPSRWDVVPLGRLFKRESRAPKPDTGIVTAFRDGQVALRSRRRMEGFTEAIQEIGYQGIEAGDLVIHAMDGFAGAIGVAEDTGKSSPVYAALTPADASVTHPRFFAYVLRNYAVSGFIQSFAQGVRERSTDFRWATAKAVPVPKPDLETQRAIVDYLDHETAEIDTFITDLKGLISLQTEKTAAVLENLIWPGGSSDIALRRVLESVDQGHSPEADSSPAEPGGVGLLKAGCTNFGVFNVAANKSLAHMGSLQGFKFVERGDLIVTRASGSLQHVGSAAVVPELDRKLAMSDKHYRIRTTPEYSSEYLAVVMMTEKFKNSLRPEISGAEGLARNVSLASLKSMKVPNVSEGAQIGTLRIIRDVQDDARNAYAQANRAIALAEERRMSLISAAVTGQLDVTQRDRPVVEQLEEEVLQKV